MTQTSNTFKGKATKVKFLLFGESKRGEIIIVCKQIDEDSIEAITSMIGESFIIEHNKNNIISIKLVK